MVFNIPTAFYIMNVVVRKHLNQMNFLDNFVISYLRCGEGPDRGGPPEAARGDLVLQEQPRRRRRHHVNLNLFSVVVVTVACLLSLKFQIFVDSSFLLKDGRCHIYNYLFEINKKKLSKTHDEGFLWQNL